MCQRRGERVLTRDAVTGEKNTGTREMLTHRIPFPLLDVILQSRPAIRLNKNLCSLCSSRRASRSCCHRQDLQTLPQAEANVKNLVDFA